MENKGKYYITTAIAYTSGKPHIGNVYEIVLADAIARYKRLVGFDVRFQTGTDEHGQKIEDKAKAANKTPQEFVDGVADIIREQFDGMNVSYDKFMRTTDPYHEKQVQKIFKKLYEKGDIYKSEYEGLYCKECESFFTESQLVDGKCPDCGRAVEPAKEEAYFFRMSNYADRLMKHIEENPHFIQPESRKNEMVNNFIKPGLQDLCVSRTSFKWGIPVDFDPKHVVYVWIDALTNYITGLGFDLEGNHDPLFNHYWPADVHLIGKDILRFHTIYWPIMLMALDIELPKQVFGHPWLLVGEGKMSKSKGNVIYADDLCRYFGVDAVRYIMLHEMPFAQDGTVTYELMIERINSDLANIFGNLVNRTISMTNKYFGGLVENTNCKGEFDDELIQIAKDAVIKVDKKMDELKVADAIDEIITLLRRSNKYIDETTPWALGKDEAQHERLKTVLYNLLESIRYAAILLKPFLPETAEKVLDQLNTQKRDYDSIQEFGLLESGIHVTDKPEILFARLDEKETLEKIEAETVKPQVKVSKLPEITIDDFAKIEMVVGQVISCEKHPKADKLLVSQIDIGGEVRQIVSGIALSYTPETMVGKKVVVIINLKPANLRGVESQGMILAGATDKQIEVLNIQDLPIGTQVK
ncbi:MAG: methionine--tRNA ligase [Anaerorhabdus sp.]|uniref:methionine--tRNA ligase n=1 Tax=Anaerorhabdus sp. TaxID=1872524 RepID=UPI002FC7B039